MEFSKSAAPFRNWALGQSEGAGAWGRDEIRNIRGAFNNAVSHTATDYSGAFKLTRGAHFSRYNADGVYFWGVDLDVSRFVPTGPQNVPQHIWQPVVIYLGRPR